MQIVTKIVIITNNFFIKFNLEFKIILTIQIFSINETNLKNSAANDENLADSIRISSPRSHLKLGNVMGAFLSKSNPNLLPESKGNSLKGDVGR